MNMTAVFVVQAPQRNPVLHELEGFMKKLQSLAYGPKLRQFDVRGRILRSNYETEYVDVFRQVVEAYIAWRRQIVTPILDKLLLTEINESESAEEVAKWTRESFQAVLEVAVNENAKYGMIFIGSQDEKNIRSTGSFDPFTASRAHFPNFLSEIIKASIAIIRPRLINRLDIQASIQLVTWLGQYDYQSMAEDNGAASSHEEDALDDLDSDAMTKARLAMQLKEALTELVFERMNTVLLRDIEKYVPKLEDLEPRSAIAVAKSVSTESAEKSEQVPSVEDEDLAMHIDPSVRAENVLGPGFLNAYAPVKTAVRLLTIYNDLTRDSRAEDVCISSEQILDHTD